MTKNEKHTLSTTTLAWFMWLIAALFYVLDYFLHTAPAQLLAPMSNTIYHNINTKNLAHIGNVMSIYFPVYAICQLPAGYFLDRFGVRIPLTIACLVVGLGLWISTMASIETLIIGRILTAAGSAFAFLGALKTAAMWLPGRQLGLAVGLTNSLGTILGGAILGLPLLNKLISDDNWQHALTQFVYLCIIVSLLMLLFLRTNTAKKKSPGKNLLLQPISHKQIISSIFLALYAGIMVGIIVNAMGELYGVTILQQTLNISKTQATDISAWLFVGIAIGGPTHGYITSRFKINPPLWMLIFCAISCLIYLLQTLLYSTNAPAFCFVILTLLSGFSVSSMLLAFSWTREFYPKYFHARVFALINMIIATCGYGFQRLFGWMEEIQSKTTHPNLQNNLLLFSIPLLLSLLLCYVGTRKNKAINEE
jgi:MFS family permease